MIPSTQERRQFPRCKVQGTSKAFLFPQMVYSDQLIDISMGGVSFEYSKSIPLLPGQYVLLNMVKNLVSYEDIPAIVSSDTVDGNNGFNRRCGIRFTRLTDKQKDQLAVLIEQIQISSLLL